MTAVPVCLQEAAPVMNHGSQPTFWSTAMRDQAASKNGPRRLIFGMKANRRYYDETQLGGTSSEFPFSTGSSYIGSWKKNKKHGFGTLVLTNGSKYEGEFQEDKRHGKGTYWIKDSKARNLRKLYSGEWKADKRDGEGVYYYADGGRYEGGWFQGKRHGRGMMVYEGGEVYQGDWEVDGRSGLGILKLPNGDRYEGSWMADKKEGPGVYHYASTGKVLEGEWVDGICKCGQLRDADPEPDMCPTGVTPTEPFTIPALELERPDAVLGETITRIRQDRVRSRMTADDDGGKIFTDEELEYLYQVFSTRDVAGTFKVESHEVHAMLHEIGLPINNGYLSRLFELLGVRPDTLLSFDQFVDIAAMAMQTDGEEEGEEEEERPEVDEEDEGGEEVMGPDGA